MRNQGAASTPHVALRDGSSRAAVHRRSVERKRRWKGILGYVQWRAERNVRYRRRSRCADRGGTSAFAERDIRGPRRRSYVSTMNLPVIALAWEIWRRGCRHAFAMLGMICLCVFINAITHRAGHACVQEFRAVLLASDGMLDFPGVRDFSSCRVRPKKELAWISVPAFFAAGSDVDAGGLPDGSRRGLR